MRVPQFADLQGTLEVRAGLEQQRPLRVDAITLLNAIAWCSVPERPLDQAAYRFMAYLIEHVAASGAVAKARRNKGLVAALEHGRREHGTLAAAAEHLAHEAELSSEHLINLYQAKNKTSPLVDFVFTVEAGLSPSAPTLKAAREAIDRLKNNLQVDGGKASALRARLGISFWKADLRPRFAALQLILEGRARLDPQQRRPLDIALLMNAIAWCRTTGRPLAQDGYRFLAYLIERVLAPRMLARARRAFDQGVHERASTAALARHQENEEKRPPGGKTCPLIDFVFTVEIGQTPSKEALAAARNALGKLVKTLLTDGGKGNTIRAHLGISWSEVNAWRAGQTDEGLREELLAEIEALYEQRNQLKTSRPSHQATNSQPTLKAQLTALAVTYKTTYSAVQSAYQRVGERDIDALEALNQGCRVDDDRTGEFIAVLSSAEASDLPWYSGENGDTWHRKDPRAAAQEDHQTSTPKST